MNTGGAQKCYVILSLISSGCGPILNNGNSIVVVPGTSLAFALPLRVAR